MSQTEIEMLEAKQNAKDLESMEVSIDNAKSSIDLHDSLQRLLKNRDFKKIIEEDYFKATAIRLVYLKTDPSFQDEQGLRQVEHQMVGIASLRQHFSYLIAAGQAAKNAMDSYEATQAELLAEAL